MRAERTNEQDVGELVTEGYNGMASYKNLLRPQDWEELTAFLKTLRARDRRSLTSCVPFAGPTKKYSLATSGKKLYAEQCALSISDRNSRTESRFKKRPLFAASATGTAACRQG